MGNLRRLVTAAALLVAVTLVAVQVAAAAPNTTAKAGTSYWTTDGIDVASDWTNVATMQIPPGKYHITATIMFENFHYGPLPGSDDDVAGPAINRIDCSMFAYGNTTGYALTSLSAGGYATVTLDGVINGSSAPAPGVWIYVDCRTNDAGAVAPYAGITLVADAVASIVDLRGQ